MRRRKKNAKNEVTYDVLNYFNAFNVFGCIGKILDILYVSYERAFVATPKEEYFGEMLDQLIEHNHHHGTQMSNEKFQEAFIRVMEYEEKDSESNVNKVSNDNLFWYPITINAQKKDANITYDRLIS